ncbi:proteasome assembly chaperone family protein [Salinarchaeum laminariae]|uniref:proteasome assembly chaperone family protein n=1 Tax=Salinarchaeum laminariae TaxID=869888 RepID=UPI0020C0F940|nr:PAC2 family protein [Salinarchaeum laminariae]
MARPTGRDPSVSVHEDQPITEPVVAGFSAFGLAGLTAVDYLVDQFEMESVGHVSTGGLPSITPFTEGRPRHPTRLHADADVPLTALVSEQFVPAWAAESFGESLLSWIDTSAVDELCMVSGVPVPHGPEDHRTFWIATEDFRERRLADTDLSPMGNGFLDGVNATLLERGIDTDLAVGVLVTPVHPQAPDAEAALRLLEGLVDVYDLDVDTGPLETFAGEVSNYYGELAARLEDAAESDLPDDRMYM